VILASIADQLKQNQLASVQERCKKTETFAASLFNLASTRFQEVADEIKLSVENIVSDAEVFTIAAPVGDERSDYHRYQVVETAKQLEYFANLRNYHSWIQLQRNRVSAIIFATKLKSQERNPVSGTSVFFFLFMCLDMNTVDYLSVMPVLIIERMVKKENRLFAIFSL
jgi:hypothetical protein